SAGSFTCVKDILGQQKWVSVKPVTCVSAPRFITWQQAMQNGVQIFSAPNAHLPAEKGPLDTTELFDFLRLGIQFGVVEWLNKTLNMNPIELPTTPSQRAHRTPLVKATVKG